MIYRSHPGNSRSRFSRPAFVVEIVTSAGDDGFQFAGLTGPQRTFIVTVNR